MTFLSSIHSTTTFNTIKFLLHVYNMLMVSMHNTGWTAIQFIIFIFTEIKKQLFFIFLHTLFRTLLLFLMLHQNSWFQLNNANSDHQIWYGAVVGDTVDNVDVDIDMSSYHKIWYLIFYLYYKFHTPPYTKIFTNFLLLYRPYTLFHSFSVLSMYYVLVSTILLFICFFFKNAPEVSFL